MNHWTVRKRLSEYLNGDLTLSDRALFDAHLDRCQRCSAELEELRRTIALLRALPEPEPPANLTQLVMQRLRAGEGRPPRLAWLAGAAEAVIRPSVVGPIAALAAGAWVVLLGPGFDNLRLSTGFSERAAQPASRPADATPSRAPRSSVPAPDAFRVFVAEEGQPGVPQPGARNPLQGLRGGASAFAGEDLHSAAAPGSAGDPAVDGLDHTLRLLLDDPAAFVRRTDLLAPSDLERLVRRLAERAARQSVAPEVARALRGTRYSLRPELAVLLEPGPEAMNASR